MGQSQGSFQRFTERARQVLVLAQEEAQRFNHNYIGTEHLLLGLVREGDGVAAKTLARLGIELTKVRSAVEFIIGCGERPPSGEIGLTPRSKRVIELGVVEAQGLGHPYVGTEHLLLGLVREGDGIAAGVLESLGLSLNRLRSEVLAVLELPAGGEETIDEDDTALTETSDLGAQPRWEYRVVTPIWDGDAPMVDWPDEPVGQRIALDRALEMLGDDGWNLAGVDSSRPDRALYIFSRPY